MTASLLDRLPLWALFCVPFVSILAAIEVGFRFGSARARAQEHEPPAPVGAVVGATLGLLAFMIAFTFNSTWSRFEARKSLLLDEVNAISTAYLRADLLPESQRDATRRLLREYVDLRANVASLVRQPDGLQQIIVRSEQIQNELWRQVRAAAATSQAPPVFVNTLNTVFELHTKRVLFAARYRIPTVIWSTLCIASFLAMVGVGFNFGLHARRSVVANVVIAIMFSVMLAMIADLDRPLTGLLNVSQEPMIELAGRLERT